MKEHITHLVNNTALCTSGRKSQGGGEIGTDSGVNLKKSRSSDYLAKYNGDKLKLHFTWICSLWKVSSSFNWFMSPLQAARWIPTSGQSSSSWSIMNWSSPTAMKWSEAIESSENKELNLMASHLNVWMVAKVSMILWLSLVTWFIIHIAIFCLLRELSVLHIGLPFLPVVFCLHLCQPWHCSVKSK